MAIEVLDSVLERTGGFKNQIEIHDHLQMRESAVALTESQSNAKPFNEMMRDQTAQKQTVDPLRAHLPSPMQEATRQGGVLSVQEAKQVSAVLERFKKSQENQWNEMKNRLSNNPSVSLSDASSAQLEIKLNSMNNQFNRLSRYADIALGSDAASSGSASLAAALAAATSPTSGSSASTGSLAASTSTGGSVDFANSLSLTTGQLSKPLETFFNFIARGERQLYSLQGDIDAAFSTNSMINPAAMLKLQLKMTHVSQQLELFTSLLNKSLESSKSVFNTQI